MKIKKALALLLALCLTLAMVPASAFADGETSGTCGANITWSYSDGTLSIQGSNGMMDAYAFGDIDDNYLGTFAPPWYTYHNQIHTIIVYNGVREIGSFAFCNSSNLTSVTLPNSLTYIWDYAFYGCSSLTDVYYSGSVEQWEALQIDATGNNSLTSATIHYNSTGPGTGSTQPAQTDPAPDPTEPSQPSPSTGATEPSQANPSTETINPTQATKKLIFAKFEAYDVFTNTVFLYDDVFAGTELRYEVPENVPININGLMDKWVFCEVLESSFGSKLIAIKEAQVKHQLIIRPNPITQISYKKSGNKGQLRFLGYEYKSFSEFEIPIDITLVNSFSISDPQYGNYSTEDEIPAEWLQRLQSDYSLHYLIYGIETEAPYGFNFGEDGTPKISKFIDLGVGGEFRDIHGYIRADDSFVPVTSTNQSFQYTIRGQIETIGRNWNFSIPFHIRTEASEGNADKGGGQDDKKLNEKTENWAEKFLKNINDLRDVDVTAKGFSLNRYFNKSELEDIDKYIVFWQAICNSEPAKRAQNLPEYLKIEGCKIDGRKVLIVIEN